MKLENINVYDFEESLIASGYPMRTEAELYKPGTKELNRGLNLVKASYGNGAHGQWLTGVRVAFDLTCTNKMWVEAERYRFLEFVSSQSTMHRITKFDLSKQYCKYVDPRVINIMQEKVEEYNKLIDNKPNNAASNLLEDYNNLLKEKYLEILYTNPAGFELTARLTTNYRCLLNVYIQRHDHRLPEWREFCAQLLEELPYFKEIVEAYLSKEKN
jgi:thymidylate synthase ThyX